MLRYSTEFNQNFFHFKANIFNTFILGSNVAQESSFQHRLHLQGCRPEQKLWLPLGR